MARPGPLELAIDRLMKIRAAGDVETIDYDAEDGAMFAVWEAMKSGHRDVLRQVLRKPTWDGDIASKTSRDDLITCGLAVRCCVGGEQGYTAATYLAGTLWKAVGGKL